MMQQTRHQPWDHIWTCQRVMMLFIVLFTFNLDVKAEGSAGTVGAIDAEIFESLLQIQTLTENTEFTTAIEKLNAISDNRKLNSYTRSQVWNFYAFIYANNEKYEQAIDAYQHILKEPDAPTGLQLNAKYAIAQLYFQLSDYEAVIHFMEAWLKGVERPTSVGYMLLAQAYFQQQKYDLALARLTQAIHLEQSAQRPPPEDWLKFKVSIYFEKKDFTNMLQTYKELLKDYPKPIYLKQMAGLYGELGDDRKQLAVYDAIYLAGELGHESDILNLVYMYLEQGIPYKAGRIIEANMDQKTIKPTLKNIEILANAWVQANEHKKAIHTLDQAVEMSSTGSLYAQLARIYFDIGNYQAAAIFAKNADKKGSLKDPGNNYMLIGMAYFYTDKFESALQAFRQAKQSKRYFKSARQWEQYTLNELERLRVLEENKKMLNKENKEILTANEHGIIPVPG